MRARLPALYLAFALVVTTLLCFVTAPFFGPDEPAQSMRALALADGQWRPATGGQQGGEDQAGAEVDSGVLQAMDAVDGIRMAWEPRSRDFHDRRYGPMSASTQRPIERIRWSGRRQFVGFGNTAVYPPLFYAPAMLGWRIAEARGMTVLNGLRLARWLTALVAVVLGWAGLRLAGEAGWILLAVLLLPSTLFLEATCSQDALMIAAAALMVGSVLRALLAARALRWYELLLLTVLAAGCAMARPPYVAFGLLLLVPRDRAWWRGAAALAAVVLLSGWWRHAMGPYGLDTSDEAEPLIQMAFLHAHPLAGLGAILRGTGEAGWDLLHRGLYVVGWNDLLPHHGAALVLSACLVVCAACVPALRVPGWWQRGLLAAAVLGPLLGLSLAEYVIWTPPGLSTVYGLQPRYWLPVLPVLLLWIASFRRSAVSRATEGRPRRAKLLRVATAGIAAVACTLPWMAAHAFYRVGLLEALRINWP